MQKIIKQSSQTKSLNVIDNKTTINEILDTSTVRSVTLSKPTDQIAACSCSACVAQAQAANAVSEDVSVAASTSSAATETTDNTTTYTLNLGDGNTTVRPRENVKFVFDGISSDEVSYELTDSVSGTLVITYGDGDTLTLENLFYFGKSTAIVIEAQFEDTILNNQQFLDAANIQYWVKSLSDGRVADTDENIVYYCFAHEKPSYLNLESEDISNWNSFQSYQRELVKEIFASIEESVNIKFIETNNPEQANTITFQNVDFEKGYWGTAYMPLGEARIGSDVYISNELVSGENAASGKYAQTYTHEILHALGISHSFDDGDKYLISEERVTPWTVMSYSYNHPDQLYVKELLAFDMAALQALYGVNENARTGNDTYTFDNSIGQLVWDGAGTDTIDASEQTDKVTIDLNDGAWSYVGKQTENISEANQLAINISTIIENAKGGSSNDTLNGNEANNKLYGNNGSDKLYGNDGKDYLNGGNGSDWLYGGNGNDTLYGGNDADRLYGGNGDDILYDYSGNNWYYGGAGNDSLSGGRENDRMYGGDDNDSLFGQNGNDILSGGNGNDRAQGGNGVDVIYGDAGSDRLNGNNGDDRIYGGNDEDYLFGDEGNDRLYGNNGDDFMRGGIGNDYLNGGANNDRLYGDEGDDSLHGGSGNDRFNGNTGNDALFGDAGNDRMWGDEGNDKLNGGDGDDRLIGGEGDDTLYGNDDNDWLSGTYGNDKLYGGNGDDTFRGGEGNDYLVGGQGNDTFIFAYASSSHDTIADFLIGSDMIELQNYSAFERLTDGRLSSSNFVANNNGVATDSNDFIIYNTSTGELSYDADGSGSGAAYTFATLSNHATLTHNDIVIT